MTENSFAIATYGNCEDVDGYYADGCVWDNEIDIYDTSAVLINYDNGMVLNYLINTFLPYEGLLICISGENGRLDVRIIYMQPCEV